VAACATSRTKNGSAPIVEPPLTQDEPRFCARTAPTASGGIGTESHVYHELQPPRQSGSANSAVVSMRARRQVMGERRSVTAAAAGSRFCDRPLASPVRVVFRSSDLFSLTLKEGAPAFFALWGIPFVVAAAYVTIGRFFVDAWQRSRTELLNGPTNRGGSRFSRIDPRRSSH
jgi:hypothetical protein